MKTQRKTLRGIVTSSILAFALAAGMVPAHAMAFAAEQINQDIAISNDGQNNFGEESNTNTGTESATSGTDSSAASNNASSQQSTVDVSSIINGSAGTGTGAGASASANNAGESESASAGAASAAPAASPVYTTDTIERISANIPVGATEPVVVGNIEYGGLTYRINPDEKTVSLVGLGSNLQSGNIVVPSQVASGSELYSVTSIEKIMGGGTILS